MRKRIVSLMLALCLIIGAVPINGFAVSGPIIVDSGVCGDNLTWTLDSEGLLTISGAGEMEDFYEPPWYAQAVRSVVMDEGITSIGWRAFYKCAELKTIALPQTVVEIGNGAFYNCTSLTRIDLPNALRQIRKYAFYGCSSLTSISFPTSLEQIDEGAFKECTTISKLEIPDGVYICREAFLGCTNLEKIILPYDLKTLNEEVFMNCPRIQEITIPKTLTDICEGCFWNGHPRNIYYLGNESQWNQIHIWMNNDSLGSSTIHFNSSESTPDSDEIVEVGDKVVFGGHTYQLIYSRYGFNEIESFLESTGGYLACLTSKEEDEFAYNYIKTCWRDTAVFGFTDNEQEGVWKWVSGEETKYTNWGVGEPNNQFGGENWACYESGTGKWNDGHYPSNCYYLCEWTPKQAEITLRTDKSTLIVNERLPIVATMRTPSGFNENDITWISSDESIATVTPTGALVGDYTSATAVISGLSEGTVTITATLVDGRSGSYTVKVVPASGLPLKEYNEYKYRADLLLNRDDTSMKGTYAGIKADKTPCDVFIDSMKNDYSLLYSTYAWEDVNHKLNTLAGPSAAWDYAFEEKDFYTALILDILQASASDAQENWVEDMIGSVKELNSGIKSFMKMKYNVDNFGGLTDTQKQEMEKWLKEYFHEEVSFGRWDTGHEAIGAVDKVFDSYGKMMDVYSEVEDFVEHVASAYALIYMSEDMKSVVRSLYDNSADIPALHYALSDIVKTLGKSEDDLYYKLMNDAIKIVGAECVKKLVDKFWDNTIMAMSPEIKLLVSVYKANKWVINQLGNVDAISEKCHNIIMMRNFERVLNKTETALVRKYKTDKTADNAAVFLSCVDIEFATWKKDCEIALAFAKAVDSDSTPLKEGLKSSVIEAFFHAASSRNPSTTTNKFDKIERSITSIKSSYSQIHDSLWNGWINELDADYPDSGLFEKNYNKLITNGTQPNSVQKKVVVACPVNVNVYKNGELVAYTEGNRPFCAEDMTIAIVGDEKTLYFHDDSDYRLECIGTGIGTMDVTIEEYGADKVQVNNVEFRNIPLTENKVYQAEISRGSSNNTEYTIVSNDGTIIKPDDIIQPGGEPTSFTVSFDPNGGAGTMASIEVKDSNTMVLPDCGFSAPEGKKFAGWLVNGSEYISGMIVVINSDTIVTAIWETDTQPPAEVELPFDDVPINSWYYQGVQYVYRNGLMAGVSSTKFAPSGTTTRGQIVTILYRLERSPAVGTSGKFSDVRAGKWYSDAVEWAAKNQIVSGYGNGKFGPEDSITREQMVSILYRYAKHKGLDISETGDLSSYSDMGKISAYALEPMRWAVTEGVISGMPGKKLGPKANNNRAEVVVILERFCKKFAL